MKKTIKATNPEQFRGLLIEAARAVVDGRITVPQANALSSLSSEVHKSIKTEYVGQILASKTVSITDGRLVNLIEG